MSTRHIGHPGYREAVQFLVPNEDKLASLAEELVAHTTLGRYLPPIMRPETPEMQELRARMIGALAATRFSRSTHKAFPEEFAGIRNADELLQLLIANREVVRLPTGILVHRERIGELRTVTRKFFESNAEMNVAAFRDLPDVRVAGSRLRSEDHV